MLNSAKNIVLKVVSANAIDTITSKTGGTYGIGYTQAVHSGVRIIPQDGLKLSLSRLSAAGTLEFSYFDDQAEVSLQMGDRIFLDVDGVPVFRGYLFEKIETKDKLIQAKAYDCLRYLLNTDSYVRPTETYQSFVRWVASEFGFKFTAVNEQWTAVDGVVAENETFLDVMNKYKRNVVLKTGDFYEVCASRQEHGSIIFRSMAQYPWMTVLSPGMVEDYEYTETIDTDVANIVDVQYTDNDEATRTVTRKNDALIKSWGPLWVIEKVNMKASDATIYANTLLALLGEPQRKFRLSSVLTDTLLVEAGSPVVASFELDNRTIQNWMLIDSIVYNISSTLITADIVLLGNGINAK